MRFGEVLHVRLRKGSANTSRGMLRFCDELIARVERAGATGPKLLRADWGFWLNKTFERLDRAGWQFSIGVRLQPAVRVAIEQVDEHAWTALEDYPPTSIAQIAETTLGGRRLVVRRVRTLDRQGELLPSWELFPVATNRTDDLASVEAEHRQHAVVELAIRDLKTQRSRTFRRASSSPTPPGRSSRASRTTCCAGPRCSGCPARPSAPPARCADDCSRCPAG